MNIHGKILMDLEKLNTHNAQGCAACNGKFSLGDTAVLACGFWEDGPRLVHEHEAVFDAKARSWVERQCYRSRR
jgi:hypothetical protein